MRLTTKNKIKAMSERRKITVEEAKGTELEILCIDFDHYNRIEKTICYKCGAKKEIRTNYIDDMCLGSRAFICSNDTCDSCKFIVN